jgi:long-subunit acyl-CoA synthetase (AMP-forming)
MPESLDTFPRLLLHNAKFRADRPAIREKDLGIWQSWSWSQVAEEVRTLSCGLAAQYQLLDGLTKQQFARAMHELMLDKRIVSDKVGQYSNRNPRYVLVEVHT